MAIFTLVSAMKAVIQGCNDEELIKHIRRAVDLKPKKHEFLNQKKRIVRFMAMTGG